MELKGIRRAVRIATLNTIAEFITELIDRVYLPVESVRHKQTGKTVTFVNRATFVEFQQKYLSLSAVAKVAGTSRPVVKVTFDCAGIEPIFEPKGIVARFYKKADLNRVGFAVD